MWDVPRCDLSLRLQAANSSNSSSVAVPPYTTYKGQRKWRPRSLVQSGVVQEEDNKDESASGTVGHGKKQTSPALILSSRPGGGGRVGGDF